MPKLIPHSRPTIGREEVRAVAAILASGQLAQGEQVRRFEAEMAARLGRRGAVAVSSGTAALHLLLHALGVGPGDEVILPSYVCVAPFHAVQHAGATPRLADSDPATFNLDAKGARAAVSRRTRALIVPHLFGRPAEMDDLRDMGIPLIEDCAQALGAVYRGTPAGSLGEAAVLSFYATKVLTTGEGGMVLADDRRLLDRMRDLRDYDERKDIRLRFNYKMTDLQAAVGRAQLRRLSGFVRRRRALARAYAADLRALPLELPSPRLEPGHIFYRFAARVAGGLAGHLRALAARGVTCRRPVYQPIHRLAGLPGYPGTDEAWARALSIPIYPSLTEAERRRVVVAVQEVLGR